MISCMIGIAKSYKQGKAQMKLKAKQLGGSFSYFVVKLVTFFFGQLICILCSSVSAAI